MSITDATRSRTQRAAEGLQSGARGLRESAQRYAGAARGGLQTAQRRTVNTVRERPAFTVLTAFGLGLFLGYVIAALAPPSTAWSDTEDMVAH